MLPRLLIGLWLLIAFVGCKKSYQPPVLNINFNYLVADGSIICGDNQKSTLWLSRTQRLSDTFSLNPVSQADVHIETQMGTSYLLQEKQPGYYESDLLSLSPGSHYRLRITTSGSTYLSDFAEARQAPPIDQVSWRQNTEGNVDIFLSTADPANSTRYYRWDITETWSYSSVYQTPYALVNNNTIVVKNDLDQTDSCWRTALGTDILVANTSALAQDVVSNFKLTTIANSTERISKRYSLLVKQYAIGEGAYRYLQLMKKNTEQLGTLFDPQPSQLSSNIRNISNETEPVIGYVYASTVSTQRIFITQRELSNWNYRPAAVECGNLTTAVYDALSFPAYSYPDTSVAPYYFVTGGMVLAKKSCLDCRRLGGINTKPAFW